MAIWEFSSNVGRGAIGFVESDPMSAAATQLADFELYRLDEALLSEPRKLAETQAVIFQQLESKPRLVIDQLRRFAPRLMWHDCRIFIQPVLATPGGNGPAFRGMIVQALDELRLPASGLSIEDAQDFGSWFDGLEAPRLTPCVHLSELPQDWRHIARLISTNPAADPPNYDLQLDVVDKDGVHVDLSLEQEVLIRRAFWNCKDVRLVGVGNGLSGIATYRGYAHLQQGAVGSKWPYLYFIKIGDRGKISREYLNYRANALENVPYHLGPRLRMDRCALGHTQGVIVSDYVSGAEALRDCAKDGRAAPVIANLLNTTLWAWRNSAEPEQTPLNDFIAPDLDRDIPRHREPLITGYGGTTKPTDLRLAVKSANLLPVLVGVVHGDLHATNVLVRGNDAIIIDFEKVGLRKPLLTDLASLEGGLFVDGFIGDRRSGAQLLASLDCLYDVSAFLGEVSPCHPSDPSTWFYDCVRQIRMQAKQIELRPLQYAWTLAVSLARKACNEEDFRAEDERDQPVVPKVPLSREDVRALAYVLAERIMRGIENARQ